MLGSDYADQVCSAARTLEVVGERWTLLILRDVYLGLHRFDELVESLGVTRTVLTRRLTHLVEQGVLERRPYSTRPERFEYHASDKGRELFAVIGLLMQWGDRHYPHPDGPPRLLTHRDCGGSVVLTACCGHCGTALDPDDVVAEPGPALQTADGRIVAGERARRDSNP